MSEQTGSPWVPVIVLLLLAAGIGVFLFLGTSPSRFGGSLSRFPDPKTLQSLGTLDAAWTVTSLDGRAVRAGDLRGKVVFINHWATWCPPCRAEMPSIQSLYESLKDDDIVFLVVSEEPASRVRSLRKSGWFMPMYVTEELPPVLATKGIPATFVVNRKGEIVYRWEVAADWDTDDCRTFLRNIP